MQVRTPIKVRYGETDMMGVVYHANYLLYFEDARTDFLEQVGFPYTRIEDAGYMCPIYHVDLQYGEPLRYGEDAFVLTRVVKNAPTKTTYLQEVYRASATPGVDKPLAAGHVTACTVERDTFKPVSIKRTFPELYALYETLIEPEE
ncbi:MAG: thioesterase family protein [Eggerthellaceae bacterium]|nr:thioesterase family protein [Eggerthellaceae bacterium]